MTNKEKYPQSQIDQAFDLLKVATKSRPITSEELGNKLGIEDIEGNWRARDLITEVMRQKQLPLGAKGHGYYVIQDLADLQEYRRELDRRIAGIINRRVLVEEAFRVTYGEPAESAEEAAPEDI